MRYFTLAKLKSGENVENVTKYISDSELSSLKDTKAITIPQINNNYFQPGEEVKLFIDLQNIKSLIIKVYQINLENYYAQSKAPFDNSISLEGINPTDIRINLELSSKPIEIKRYEFAFE